METFYSAIVSSLITLSDSFACTFLFERGREKKDKIRIIRLIFMSLINNRESFTREKNVLKNRMEQDPEALLRPAWPIKSLDYYDYRKDASFLLEKSGVKILNGLYEVNNQFLNIQRMKEEHIIPTFNKYNSDNRSILETNMPHLESALNVYQMYIKYINYYLSTANKLIEDLKIYAENELKFKLVEPSLSEDKVSLLRFRP